MDVFAGLLAGGVRERIERLATPLFDQIITHPYALWVALDEAGEDADPMTSLLPGSLSPPDAIGTAADRNSQAILA